MKIGTWWNKLRSWWSPTPLSHTSFVPQFDFTCPKEAQYARNSYLNECADNIIDGIEKIGLPEILSFEHAKTLRRKAIKAWNQMPLEEKRKYYEMALQENTQREATLQNRLIGEYIPSENEPMSLTSIVRQNRRTIPRSSIELPYLTSLSRTPFRSGAFYRTPNQILANGRVKRALNPRSKCRFGQGLARTVSSSISTLSNIVSYKTQDERTNISAMPRKRQYGGRSDSPPPQKRQKKLNPKGSYQMMAQMYQEKLKLPLPRKRF